MAALGGLIAAVPFVGAAQAPAPDRSAHLLVVPDTPQAEAALAGSDARTVASYESFTLVEARGGDDAALRAAGADRRDDMRRVSLPAGGVDPLRGRDSLAARGTAEPDEVLALVQFEGPVKDTWRERLGSSGVRIVQYVPQNGYLVHANGAEVDRLAALVGTDGAVRAVTRVTAADKVSEALAGSDRGARMVAVQTLTGSDGAAARRAVATAGPELRSTATAGGLATQYTSLSASERSALARDPAIVAITPYATPRPLDERSAQIVAGNISGAAPTSPTYLNWLAGRGFGTGLFDFAIDIADTGFDNGSSTSPGPAHSDFRVDGQPAGASRVMYAEDYTSDPSSQDCGGHGTNVASIAAGYNASDTGPRQDASGFQYGLGAAPRARLGASKIFSCGGVLLNGGEDLSDVAEEAWASGARISNHSWGYRDLGRYGPDSRALDFLVRDASGDGGHQEMVEVVAAGNEGDNNPGGGNEGWGSVASPGTAKNVITVGASESSRPLGQITCGLDDGDANDARDIAGFSSRGPTLDGRLKPDVVAPGTRVVGAAPQTGAAYTGVGVCLKNFPAGNVFYSMESGTSQAAPAVSGAAALIRHWFTEIAGQPEPPSPALTKALLINTATDLAGGQDGKGARVGYAPNADEGWGRANVGGVFDGTQRSFVDQSTTLTTGDRFGRSYVVSNPARPLKVTLAWTDAPGMVDTEAFVNDLDLVVRQGGRTYKGNVLAGGRSISGGEADHRNNLESVVLPGASGPFSVEVRGTAIAGDGVPGNGDDMDQDFALVVSNGQEQPAAVLAPEAVTVDDPAGDNDNSLESSEPFTLDVDLANGGDAPATGVTGMLTGPGLSFSGNTADWGDIEPGDTEGSDSPFAGTRAAGTACGADVAANLALQTGAGNQTVPVIIPTGEPGPPLNHPRTVNGAIPDESSVGLTTQMAIGTSTRIRDLNVRVDIDHQWVGDLVVELTSPAGTTVRLADHPGGPDNGGQDLANTLFDDEAPTNISSGSAPYAGSFRPQNDQLSRFDGQQLQGTWTLRVRDLFEGKTGSLRSWGMVTSPAVCDFDGSVLPDTRAPQTTIVAGPAGSSRSRTASFRFGANEPDPTFECGIDGGPLVPCQSSAAFGGLADGTHTLRVRARDPSNNVDSTPAVWSWTVDVTAPATSISSPRAGAELGEARPRISGSAGTAAGDSASVRINLWRGRSASGPPAQTVVAHRDAGGAWSGVPTALADGTWTARADQSDAAGNTGVSATRTFSVHTTAPTFAIAPVEADRADTLRNKLTIVAGCGAACKVSVKMRGRGRRPPLLGRATKALKAHSTGAVRVRLTKAGRASLRRAARAKLTVTVAGAGPRINLRKTISFREVDPRRVAARGLRFAGSCAEQCSISANLLMRPKEARRHGLRAPAGKQVRVGGGSAGPAAGSTPLSLRFAKKYRAALGRRRSVKVTIEALVRGPTGPSARAAQRLTLQR